MKVVTKKLFKPVNTEFSTFLTFIYAKTCIAAS